MNYSRTSGRVVAPLLFLAVSAALAGASDELLDGGPVLIGTYRTLRSEVLDEDRTLLVSLPEDYEQSTLSYPVLYVLYGENTRGYFTEAVNVVDGLASEGSMPQTIVVGVVNVDRYRDLSPVGRGGRPSGIEAFSKFMVEELIPFIEREYRTKNFRILMGPQAGSPFGVYTLVKRPGLFDAFILENPLRNEEVRFSLLQVMTEIPSAGFEAYTFVHVACPDRVGFRDASAGVKWMREFEVLMKESAPANFELVTRYIENNKDFIPSLLLKEALRELYADYVLPTDMEVNELADIASHYAALSERLGFEVDVPERVLAMKADELTAAGSSDAGLEVLTFMVELYPASLDGYWRLANLQRERGDHEEAIRHYHRCLELMPNMVPARDWIERLEGSR